MIDGVGFPGTDDTSEELIIAPRKFKQPNRKELASASWCANSALGRFLCSHPHPSSIIISLILRRDHSSQLTHNDLPGILSTSASTSICPTSTCLSVAHTSSVVNLFSSSLWRHDNMTLFKYDELDTFCLADTVAPSLTLSHCIYPFDQGKARC